jgi:hypothetical protein
MTSPKTYLTVVAGLSEGDAPVKFTMKKTFARSEFQEEQAPLPRQNLATGCDPALIQERPLANPRFKVEVGVTKKDNVLICRTTYSQVKGDHGVENKKDKVYTSFASISAARTSLDASAPADAACIYQMRDLKDWESKDASEV